MISENESIQIPRAYSLRRLIPCLEASIAYEKACSREPGYPWLFFIYCGIILPSFLMNQHFFNQYE